MTPIEVVAPTRPALAWRGPFNPVASWSPFVPETVRAVVDAYGKVEAVLVVAVKYPAKALIPRSDEP